MKKTAVTLYLTTLFLLSLSLTASAKFQQAAPTTGISGTFIKYEKGDYVELVLTDPIRLLNKQEKIIAPVANGAYQISFDISKPREFRLVIRDSLDRAVVELRQPLALSGDWFLIEQGDSMHFEYSGDRRLSRSVLLDMEISGKGGEKFKLLQDINRSVIHANLLIDGRDTAVGNLIKKAEAVQRLTGAHIAAAKYKISQFATRYIRESLSYDHAVLLTMLKKGRPTFSSTSDYIRGIIKPMESEDVDIPILETCILYLAKVKKKVLFDLSTETETKIPDNYAAIDPQGYYNYVAKRYQGRLREILLSMHIALQGEKTQFNGVPGQLADRFVNDFNSESRYVKVIKSLYDNAKANLYEGAPAYNFSLKDTTGKSVTLGDFKGKVVLLDFWFTGCTYCKAIAPYLGQLEQSISGRDVVFVSISIDTGVAQWKKSIGEFSSAASIQLYTNGQGGNHEIIKHYQISGYPRLILIDKEGKIASLNFPRPWKTNIGEVKTMLEKFL